MSYKTFTIGSASQRVRLSFDGTLELWENVSPESYQFQWVPIEWSWLETHITSSHELWPLLQADRKRRGLQPLECPIESRNRDEERFNRLEARRLENRLSAIEEATGERERALAAKYGYSDLEEFRRVVSLMRAFQRGLVK